MAHKITMKVSQSDTAADDFAALADQLIQDSWHLPPGGDQSWRELDAARIFSGHGEDGVNDADTVPMMVEEEPASVEEEWPQEPGIKASRVVGVLLPISLATIVMGAAVIFSMPQLVAAHIGDTAEAAARGQVSQARVNQPAVTILAPQQRDPAPGKLRPSLMDDASTPAAEGIHTTDLQQSRPAMSGTEARTRPNARSQARLATTGSLFKTAPRVKHSATRLPPIGAAYFASHAPAVAVRKEAAADWNTETAKWDEMAARIQARRERNQENENAPGAEPRVGSARESP